MAQKIEAAFKEAISSAGDKKYSADELRRLLVEILPGASPELVDESLARMVELREDDKGDAIALSSWMRTLETSVLESLQMESGVVQRAAELTLRNRREAIAEAEKKRRRLGDRSVGELYQDEVEAL